MRTFFGATVDCDLGDLITMCIFHFGVWEPHISAFIQGRLRPGDVFCDVGANIGYHSLLASGSVGSSGRVVAIEPSPAIFARLISNLRLNEADNVRPVQAAVTAAVGTVSLYRGVPGNTAMTTTIKDRGFGKECDVISVPLTDILSQDERERLRLIKIDVEGGEVPILNDLIATIDHYSHELEILVEVTQDDTIHSSKEIPKIFSQFSELGFRAYSIPNSYDRLEDYLNFPGIRPPIRITSAIRGQQDVLFSRSYDLS